MTPTSDLRARAEALGSTLPPLLAKAEQLAQTVILGAHGRRRAGMGDDFWQYRAAHTGDAARAIDWRRSARSDSHFVREREWQAAQSVVLWVDLAQSMDFTGVAARPTKSDRARLLALALSVLLLRGGERVALSGQGAPRSGRTQLLALAQALTLTKSSGDYGHPSTEGLVSHGRAVFLSDFLGDPAPAESALVQAADRGIKGLLIQVLDPLELTFPWDGRTVFTSMGGSLAHETQQAGDLRARYLDRLAARQALLADLARRTGWLYLSHDTGKPAQTALVWAYQALEGGR